MRLLCFLVFLQMVTGAFASGASRPPVFHEKLFLELKKKTIQQAICTEPKTYLTQAACRELAKTQDLNWMAPVIEVQSSSLFHIQNGSQLIEVSRTAKSNVFSVNHKEIDLEKFRTFSSLKIAIANAIPRTARWSWLMNQAYAQGMQLIQPSTERLTTTVALILKTEQDQDLCESAKSAYLACTSFPRNSSAYKGLVEEVTAIAERLKSPTGRGMTRDERKFFDLSIAAFQTEMKVLGFSLGMVDHRQAALQLCPSSQTPTKANAWEDLQDCKKQLSDNIAVLAVYSRELLPVLRGTDRDLELLLNGQQPAVAIPDGPAVGTH